MQALSVPENPLPKVRPTFHSPIIFGSCDDFVWWNARGFEWSVMATKRYGQKEGAVLWLTFLLLEKALEYKDHHDSHGADPLYINKNKVRRSR